MEEGLIVKKAAERIEGWREIGEEMKRVSKLAGPMVAVVMSQYMLQVVTLMMVGHLGKLFLSSTALALSIAAVTGFSLLSGLQNLGGAIAMGISNWLNAIFLVLYMKFSSSCSATRSSFSMEIFHGVGEFFRFAVPSTTMVCFEWWCFELLILLLGLLPNPELETSVLSVCLTTVSTLFAIPYGISTAASTRVANELGGKNPQAARKAAFGVVVMGIMNGLIVSAVLFATRKYFGYCFSNEKEVIDYVTTMAPLVCVNIIFDSTQAVLSGVARGCGWQHLGSLVNLAAYYLVGIPVAATFGFRMQLRGRGLWLGVLCGAMTQCVLLAIITSRTNWEEESRKAIERLVEESSKVSDGVHVDEQKPLIN